MSTPLHRLSPLLPSVLLLLAGCGKGDAPINKDSGPVGRQLEGPLGGQRVAATADLTGDGLPDLLVSAPDLDGSGALYLFDGSIRGALGPDDASHTLSASGPGDVGTGLAACGDVDGDGMNDLAIGLPDGNSGRGGVWLASGPIASGSLGDLPLVRGTDPDIAFGHTVSCAGDVDGDGRADLAVSAPFADGFGAAKTTGEIKFFHVLDAEPVPFASLATTYEDEWLGHDRSIDLSGDLDGDGVNDAVIGGPGESRVHILFGPMSGTLNAAGLTAVLDGREDDDRFGATVAVGDVNGDGQDDLIAGAPDWGPQSGAIAVVLGPIERTTDDRVSELGRWIDGQDPKEYVGTSLTVADLNGDGLDDILAGAPGATTSGPEAGVVYGLLGPAEMPSVLAADHVLVGTTPYAQLGYSVAAVPDVDGDGLHEVLVGGPTLDVGDRIGAGGAWLFASPLPDRAEDVAADATILF